jgi:hypothetical protein
MATLTALVALSIDMVLPALPAIGESLGVQSPNQNQLVVSLLFLGFGVGQLFLRAVLGHGGQEARGLSRAGALYRRLPAGAAGTVVSDDARRAAAAGHWRRRAADDHDRARPRSLRGARDGARDVARDRHLHHRADRGAGDRSGGARVFGWRSIFVGLPGDGADRLDLVRSAPGGDAPREPPHSVLAAAARRCGAHGT